MSLNLSKVEVWLHDLTCIQLKLPLLTSTQTKLKSNFLSDVAVTCIQYNNHNAVFICLTLT